MSESTSEGEISEECPVCFCDMSKTIKAVMPCNHSVCMRCILKLRDPRCVLCRYDLKDVLDGAKDTPAVDDDLRSFLRYMLFFYPRGVDAIPPNVYESLFEYPNVRRNIARLTYSRASRNFLRSPLLRDPSPSPDDGGDDN